MSGLLMVGACGGGGGGGPTAEAAFTQLAGKVCTEAFMCMSTFPGTPDQFSQSFGASEAACNTLLLAQLDVDKVQASIDAGRIMFDGADVQACVDKTDFGTCDQFWGNTSPAEPPECETALVGTVANGGTCTIDLDCMVAGSSCGADLKCAPTPAAN